MREHRIAFLFVPLLFLTTSCTAALNGYPKSKPDKLSVAESAPLLEAEAVSGFTGDVQTEARRNSILFARLVVIDRNYLEFEKKLYREGLRLGIGVDWLILGLGGATATIGGTATKEALGAITAGVTGAKSSFDKRAFMEKSLIAVIAKMRAERATNELEIRRNMRLDLELYPLRDGLSDLRKYYEAGTLPNAFNNIIEAAGAEATKAETKIKDERNELREAAFLEDASSKILQKHLATGDAALDQTRYDALREWMGQNGFDNSAGSVTMFIYGDIAASGRAAAVTDLEIN